MLMRILKFTYHREDKMKNAYTKLIETIAPAIRRVVVAIFSLIVAVPIVASITSQV